MTVATDAQTGDGTGTPKVDSADKGEKKQFSQEEVDALLKDARTSAARGPGKELKKLQAQLDQFQKQEQERERASLEAKGEWEKLKDSYGADIKAKDDELTQLRAEKAAREAADKKREDELRASNQERIKSLPENMQKLVPEGLSAEAERNQVQLLEAEWQKAGGTVASRVNTAPTQPSRSLSDDERAEQRHAASLAHMTRKKPNDSQANV